MIELAIVISSFALIILSAISWNLKQIAMILRKHFDDGKVG